MCTANVLHVFFQKIEHLLGVALSEDAAKPINDDVLLCNLINKLHPGMIAMIQEDYKNVCYFIIGGGGGTFFCS